MPLSRLVLGNFRNIQQADIKPAGQLNLIYGENGSGKTSLLEAISTLALGRSFRTRKYTQVIHHDSPGFHLFAELVDEHGGGSIGISRARNGQSQFKLSGKPIHSSGALALRLPLQVINSQSFMLLEGGPSQRRRFLDWLVFHVKHDFAKIWLEYSHCLKQRNSLLRRDKIAGLELQPWTDRLISLGAQVDLLRRECIQNYLPYLVDKLGSCTFLQREQADRLEIEYLPGWRDPEQFSYGEQFQQNLSRDLKLGYTSIGPHKSDLKIHMLGKPVAEVLSRGQQKSLVNAMYMAQLNCFRELSPERDCVLLIDDLPAELDANNRATVSDWVYQLQVQTFVTGIDLHDLTRYWQPGWVEAGKVFHVKHGEVTEQ